MSGSVQRSNTWSHSESRFASIGISDGHSIWIGNEKSFTITESHSWSESEGVMTEKEWLRCKDTDPMLTFLKEQGTSRKFVMFAAACCRRIWHLMTDARSRKAVET